MANSRYKFLKTNLNIIVSRQDDDTIYKSLIQEINDDYFVIQEPVYKRFTLPLHKGQKITLGLFTEECRFTFEATVLNKKAENSLVLYVLGMPENVKKHERRSYVRVEVAMDVKYEPLKELPKDLNSLENMELTLDALAIDISGGGMMLNVGKKLPEKSYILVEFDIGSKDVPKKIRLVGQIMRSFTQSRNGVKRHLAGVHFCQIDERTRDKIIAFVFEKMLDNIRKTVG